MQFLAFALSVATAVITARALGPEGNGLYTLVILIPMIAVTFGRMGIGHAANFMAPKMAPDRLITNVAVISAILGLITVAIVLPTTILLKDIFFKDLSLRIIIFISLAIPVYLFHNHLASMVQALYEIGLRNLIVMLQALTNLILLIILVVIFDFGLPGAVIASVISICFVVLLSSALLLQKIRIKNIQLRLSLIRDLFKYGLKTHIGNVLKDLSYRLDILIISYFLPATAVGFYVAAVSLAEIVWKIPDAIGVVLLPRVANISADSAKLLTPAVCRIVFLMVVMMALCLGLFSQKAIVMFFGAEFLPSKIPLLLLLPGMISLTLWKIIATDMIAEGFPTEYSLTALISLISMVILDVLLIPQYGINGAAFATTIAYACSTISIIFIYRRFTKVAFRDLLVPTKMDLSLYRDFLTHVRTRFNRP